MLPQILSVNHSWIFHVLEKGELPEFMCHFLCMIYCNSITQVEFLGKSRSSSLWPGVSDRDVQRAFFFFFFATAFDPYRWLHDTVIPENLADPDFLQRSPCAYADDFAVASSSFQLLVTALSQHLWLWMLWPGSTSTIGNGIGCSMAVTAVKKC